MTHNVRLLDTSAIAAWNKFVTACPEGSFFHRAEWKSVTENSFGHKTYFAYAENNGVIEGVLPLVHIKSRLFDNCLISNGYCMGGGTASINDQARAALDEYAANLFQELQADFYEIRQPQHFHEGWARRNDLYATFEKPMESDEDANLKQIPRKQRAVVRKAIKSDLTETIDDKIDEFYHLYATTVRNLGTPVFAKKYFQNLLTMFGADCDILTIRSNGQAVSSVLSFYHNDKVMPYYTGAVPEARRMGAADYMYWRLMRHAMDRNCSIFDFGRSKIGTGPYSFKKNWGFEPQEVVHEFLLRDGTEMPNTNPTNPKYRAFIAMWKRLPLPVANFLGPHIVRNIG